MLGLYSMPALYYNAAVKFQYMNGLSYTHNNEFILNALLECIKSYLHYTHNYFKMFYPQSWESYFILHITSYFYEEVIYYSYIILYQKSNSIVLLLLSKVIIIM